jgi:pilus assembly protein CpaB
MRMNHVLMFGLALFCAASAAFLARSWLIRQSALAPSTAAAPSSPAAPVRVIVVAAKDMSYGDRLTPEMVKLMTWAGEELPKGAFLSTQALFGSGTERTVLHTIAQGEPVLLHKLFGGTSSNALSARLGENMQAVTIRVGEAAGLAGFAQPDDRVDVYLTYNSETGPEASQALNSAVGVLLQNVRILAIDQVTERKDRASPPKAVTLEASMEDAQRLVLGGRIGELSLALKSIADTGKKQPTQTVSFDDLLEVERRLKGQTADAAPSPPAPSGPIVTVTRATERKSYQVQSESGEDDQAGHEVLNHQGNPDLPGR